MSTATAEEAETPTEAVEDLTGMEAPIDYSGNGKASQKKASGKGKGSRWNAVRHGLMAKALFPVHLAEEIKKCTAILTDHHRPTSPYECRLIKEMGRAGAQVEHARDLLVVDLQRRMDRAVLCWDKDRCVHIDVLITKLSREPFRVSRELERSKQGVDWLIRTWEELGEVLEVTGSWEPEHLGLAGDLLGIRAEMRTTTRKIPPATDTAALKILVRKELDRLRESLKSLAALDRAAQAMAEVGAPWEDDVVTKRLKKCESAARLAYHRARAELIESRAMAAAAARADEDGDEEEDDFDFDEDVSSETPAAAASAPEPESSRTETQAQRPQQEKRSTPPLSFLKEKARLGRIIIPATGQAAETLIGVQVPSALRESDDNDDDGVMPTAEPEAGPDAVAEPADASPAKARVASEPSPSMLEEQRLERERRRRRAEQKKARKAARRRNR